MTKIKFPIIPNSRFMINSYHKTLDNDSESLVTVKDVLNDNEFSGLPVFVRLFPFKILETLIKTIKNVSKTV